MEERWVRLYPSQLHTVDTVVMDFARLFVAQEVKWQEVQRREVSVLGVDY